MNKSKILALAAAALAVMVTGCASQPASAPAYTQNEPQSNTAIASAEAKKTASQARVLDWANRGLGEEASPAWLLPALRGNWTVFKKDWSQANDKVLKIGVSRAPALNGAQNIADVQYAARLSNELKQSVLAKAAITLGSDDQFTVVNDAATKTRADMAGQERLTDFWQLSETVDKNGKAERYYTYYVVYASDPAVWSKIVAKYLVDLTDQVTDQQAKRTIAGMFAEIDADTRAEKAKSDLQFAAELRAQQAALEKPVPPASQRAAYRSGDSAQIAAAGTTRADTDYIAALAAIAGIE